MPQGHTKFEQLHIYNNKAIVLEKNHAFGSLEWNLANNSDLLFEYSRQKKLMLKQTKVIKFIDFIFHNRIMFHACFREKL